MTKPPSERIAVVDVLRAVALLGIIVTHAEMGFLAGPPPTDNFGILTPVDGIVRASVYIPPLMVGA